MAEEVEVIKYLMTNIELHRLMLKKIYDKKKVKDDIYNYIRYQRREYARFNISLRKMLENRTKKVSGTKNVLLGIATSLGNTKYNFQNNQEYIEFFKEAAKVNLMDIERIKKSYNLKSKNVIKLIDRFKEFEEKNLDIIANVSF